MKTLNRLDNDLERIFDFDENDLQINECYI